MQTVSKPVTTFCVHLRIFIGIGLFPQRETRKHKKPDDEIMVPTELNWTVSVLSCEHLGQLSSRRHCVTPQAAQIKFFFGCSDESEAQYFWNSLNIFHACNLVFIHCLARSVARKTELQPIKRSLLDQDERTHTTRCAPGIAHSLRSGRWSVSDWSA